MDSPVSNGRPEKFHSGPGDDIDRLQRDDVHIMIATPGRLLDLCNEERFAMTKLTGWCIYVMSTFFFHLRLGKTLLFC